MESRPTRQRILSPVTAIFLQSATEYHAVFIDVSAVKASERRGWYRNVAPHLSLISKEQKSP
jgi:hypothetical protein